MGEGREGAKEIRQISSSPILQRTPGQLQFPILTWDPPPISQVEEERRRFFPAINEQMGAFKAGKGKGDGWRKGLSFLRTMEVPREEELSPRKTGMESA